MTFQEALIKAVNFEKEKESEDGLNFAGIEPKTMKVLSLFWNMMAVSGKVLDDLVYINNNTDIKSISIKPEKGNKPKSSDKKKAALTDDNGKETKKKAKATITK